MTQQERKAKYRAEHRELYRRANKRYYWKNRAKRSASSKEYYQRHRREIIAKHKAWAAANRERLRLYDREFRDRNKRHMNRLRRERGYIKRHVIKTSEKTYFAREA
jgi:cupin superfamily acireductone dioxygenase involved in methionine salvage